MLTLSAIAAAAVSEGDAAPSAEVGLWMDDPRNVSELRLVEQPLALLLARLRVLLNEFPGEPVLLQLARLCHRITALPTHRSVCVLFSRVCVCRGGGLGACAFASRS